MPMTGNGSVLASYSTRPTSCLSWSNESPACSSSCVSAVRVECVEVVVMASGCRGSRKVCNSTSKHCAICPAKGCIVDALDATLLDLFAKEPRIGVLAASGSEEHTFELQSLIHTQLPVICLKNTII